MPAFGQSPVSEAKREGDSTKRTMVLTLVALGAGTAGLYFIASGGGPTADTPRVYKSVADCVAARIQPAGACEQQWNAANIVHQKGAPDYATMAACEKQHGAGKCVKPATPDDGARSARYIPVMSGYFFGKAPQGTFTGVPLYSILSDGAERYRVAEIRPKEPEDPVNSLEKSKTPGSEQASGTNRTLLFIPGMAIGATAPTAAAAAAPASGAPRAGAMPAAPAAMPAAPPAANPAARPGSRSAPAATKPGTPTTSRGGLGSSARSASAGGSGG